MSTNAGILKPPQEVLAGRHIIEDSIVTAGQRYFIYDRTEYPPEGGIFTYYKGQPFPVKGFPFPEAAYANDNVKRITRFLITLFSGKEMILPILMFAILPWKFKFRKIERMVDEYLRIAIWLQNESYLKPERYSAPAKEIGGFVYEFILSLGMDKSLHYLITEGRQSGMKRDRPEGADPTWVTMKDNLQSIVPALAKTVATIFEYDDAYRYRVEDIASETNKAALVKNPRTEILRLLKIFVEREKTHATIMIERAVKLLSFLLLHPKIKRAFVEAVMTVDFKRLGLDNADRYHVLPRVDYDFTGRSSEDRKRIYLEFHMESKCHKAPVRCTKDEEGNTVGGKCTNCWKELDTKDVQFNLPPMVEVVPE